MLRVDGDKRRPLASWHSHSVEKDRQPSHICAVSGGRSTREHSLRAEGAGVLFVLRGFVKVTLKQT